MLIKYQGCNMDKKLLKTKGELDYDYKNDILFFKSKSRHYEKSIELESFAIDIDKEGFLIGMQFFDASNFFNLHRDQLLIIKHWKFTAKVNNGKIEINLLFQFIERNKLMEKNPIIVKAVSEDLPNSEVVCEM